MRNVKIFLLTLFLTALAVSAISLLLLARSHRNTLLLAKEKIQTVRDSAVAELGYLIQERKDDSGQQLLTESDLEDLFVTFCLTSEEFRKGADGATDEAGSDGATDEAQKPGDADAVMDKARSRQSGGSGIGLSLCKAIAQAHRGSLRIESREGQGTEVSLILPVPDTLPSE